MDRKIIDVIITVHVEEHNKFYKNAHYGHSGFFKFLNNSNCPAHLTLLLQRIKEEKNCFRCDRGIVSELANFDNIEFGLHVHPALSLFNYEEQYEIINKEYNHFVDDIGIVPRSFSGGHWCINANTIEIIRGLGILVDASVAPGCIVSSNNGVVMRHSNQHLSPYWASNYNINEKDDSSNFLEMPISICSNRGIMDVYKLFPKDILNTIYDYSLSSERSYLHMTFHSYDIFSSDGKVNFIYDKLLMILEKLNYCFDEVNYLTCSQYYKIKMEEKKNEN